MSVPPLIDLASTPTFQLGATVLWVQGQADVGLNRAVKKKQVIFVQVEISGTLLKIVVSLSAPWLHA